MRKAQKKEAESFIRLLEEAHKAVSKAMEGGKNYIVQDLLEQCQEGAIKLGELIENAEGERFKTIPLLEDYCEIVYQIYEKAGQCQESGADSEVNSLQVSLSQSLEQIKDSVENDIEARTEIVFLPYKASMWDSLESVWKAANEDPECDAYVIPIPYFDKNPDGSFKEAHYEGDQYPDYVPVTDYNDYNFEARRPDVIYIHNPYDNCNHVTSVHPFFYSDNLKKFTDKLVYIPYFILGEVDPKDEKEVEWVQNYCMVPGVFHADKVIVQSEAMRQIYINVLTKEAGENSRPIWEEKILGLGSPKIDKVLGTKKEDLKIPDDWLRIIEKPDGSWKKVIFYNTGVAALLKHDEKMLEKMKNVFKTFKDNQDEVALLWRPHPLIKATIESMRPQLWQEYQKIVEQYKEEGWGIYDDTADMDRAVVLGDAYYGDGSSIVQLYRTINKSVLIQDVEAGNEEDKISICPYAVCALNNNIYVLNGINNLIFETNYESYTLKIIGEVEDRKERYGYIEIAKVNHMLVLVPDKCDKFALYDTIKQTIHYINIDINIYAKEFKDSKPGFYKAIQYQNKLFVIQIVCKTLACIDVETWQIKYIDICKKMPFSDIGYPLLTYGDFGVSGKYLYLPIYGTGYIIVINMEEDDVRYEVIEKEASISTICANKDKIYVFTTFGTKYYEIDTKKWSIKRINIQLPYGFVQDSGESTNPQVFVGSFCYDRYIWLIPYLYSNMILRINIKTGKAECVLRYKIQAIYSYKIDGDIVWLCAEKGVIKVNLQTCKSSFCKFVLDNNNENEYINNCKKTNYFLGERDIGLYKFITYLVNSNDCASNENRYEKKQKNLYWNI